MIGGAEQADGAVGWRTGLEATVALWPFLAARNSVRMLCSLLQATNSTNSTNSTVRAWTALTPAACIASATCGQKLSSARAGRSPVAVLRGGTARQRAGRLCHLLDCLDQLRELHAVPDHVVWDLRSRGLALWPSPVQTVGISVLTA